MRFSEYLAEKAVVKWTAKSIDLKQTVDLLNKHCKNGLKALSNGGLLFRGFKHSAKSMVIDSTTGERTSLSTNNLYQLMMDNSTALKGYPKRSNSLICTSSIREASTYGKVMVIVPFDDTMIVVSDEDDFISADLKSKLANNLQIDNFTNRVEEAFLLSGFKKKTQYTDIDALNKHIAANPEKFAEEWNEMIGADISKHVAGEQPFSDLSSLVMTPRSLNLTLQPFGEPIPRDRECWFSGKCVAIDPYFFSQIVSELKKQGHPLNGRIAKDIKFALDWI